MRVAALFSGGKDSVFATFWAMQQGFDVTLVTVEPEEYSMMFHHPNVKATKLQAEALGLKQVFVKASDKDWHERLKAKLAKLKVKGIVTGAIASEYQRRRIENLGEELGIPTYCPLWHKEETLLPEMLANFEIFVIAVSADGLGPELLGRPLKELVEKKVPGIHPMLEGGEGETFVTDAPFFKKRIAVEEWKKSWDGVRGVAEIKKAKLVEKE
jgi:ABC transporter with metal-binding/Fe-S-binding domain ATP-binding protein